jgi:hypothetical protein
VEGYTDWIQAVAQLTVYALQVTLLAARGVT